MRIAPLGFRVRGWPAEGGDAESLGDRALDHRAGREESLEP